MSIMFTVEDEVSKIKSLKEVKSSFEAIYAEISPKPSIEKQAEKCAKIVQIYREEKSAGQKNEVEYWQITAKEVVKFRPCKETFVKRVKALLNI